MLSTCRSMLAEMPAAPLRSSHRRSILFSTASRRGTNVCTYFCQTSRSDLVTPVSSASTNTAAWAFGIMESVSSGSAPSAFKPGRVEDDEPVLEQGVRIVDQRVAPSRDLDAVGFAQDHRGGLGARLVEQPQIPCLLNAHRLRLRQLLHRLRHLVVGIEIEPHLHPLDRGALQRRDAFVALARLDRQELDLRRLVRIVEDLRGTHRGAPDVRR